VLSKDVVAFVLGNLPPAPARVLEVGAGGGELARVLSGSGYEIVAIDPASSSDDVLPIALADLQEPDASFDAAVAIVSLHHVDPLEPSVARLAEVLRPDADLVVDEIDVERYDERAAAWWLEQRAALGLEHEHGRSAAEMVAELRAEIHPLSQVTAALDPHFRLGPPTRGSYLHRWDLDHGLKPQEEELIAAGELPAVGARLVGRRL
jgi:SAM-dependent methyltransferase